MEKHQDQTWQIHLPLSHFDYVYDMPTEVILFPVLHYLANFYNRYHFSQQFTTSYWLAIWKTIFVTNIPYLTKRFTETANPLKTQNLLSKTNFFFQ